jgi:hypothetical protein
MTGVYSLVMRLSLVFVLLAAAMPAYTQSASTPGPIIVSVRSSPLDAIERVFT